MPFFANGGHFRWGVTWGQIRPLIVSYNPTLTAWSQFVLRNHIFGGGYMCTIATQLSCILVRTLREFSCLFNQSTKRVPPCLVFWRLFAREGRRTFHDAMCRRNVSTQTWHKETSNTFSRRKELQSDHTQFVFMSCLAIRNRRSVISLRSQILCYRIVLCAVKERGRFPDGALWLNNAAQRLGESWSGELKCSPD